MRGDLRGDQHRMGRLERLSGRRLPAEKTDEIFRFWKIQTFRHLEKSNENEPNRAIGLEKTRSCTGKEKYGTRLICE